MKPPVTLLAGLALFAAAAAPRLPAAVKDKGLDVLISADAIPTPEGFRPKPGQPIHYLFSQNTQTLGERIGGVKLPEPAIVEKLVVAELAKQGFLRTDVGGAVPSLFIVATVGDANFEPPKLPPYVNPLFEPEFEPFLRQLDLRQVLTQSVFLGTIRLGVTPSLETIFSDEPYLPPASSQEQEDMRDLLLAAAARIRDRGTDQGRDRSKILKLVGAEKVERAVGERKLGGLAGERIAQVTWDNQYYVTLSAFDAARWREKQQVLLWRTTMLIDWRVDFTKALGDMLAQAGPVFGTDVPVPGYVNTANRKATVEIGETKVLPEGNQQEKPAGKK